VVNAEVNKEYIIFSNLKPKKENLVACSTNTQNNEHNCCSPQPKVKVKCPKCNENAKGVLGKTLQHLLTNEAKENLSCFDEFYYCKSVSCEVIYFKDKTILTQKDMSVVVGLKKDANPATVCYCFEWTKEKIMDEINLDGSSSALADIKNKMDTIGCQCEILNPSGGCCLGDVSKVTKEIKSYLGLKI